MPDMSNYTLILASASPRRKDLLQQAGIIPDQIIPADIDETPRRDELPRPYVLRMAIEKAQTIKSNHPTLQSSNPPYILSADTVVAVGRRILPKADTEDQARACLALLSGRRHRVLSALCLMTPDGKQHTRINDTVVMFSRLHADDIDSYIASGEWQGKAGGYGIQGRAAAFIPFISGSYSGVVGLPLYDTIQLLKGAGFWAEQSKF